MKALRYLLILPAAILGFFIGDFLAAILNGFTRILGMLDNESMWNYIILTASRIAFASGGFIYLGIITTPAHRPLVWKILCFCCVFFGIFMFYTRVVVNSDYLFILWSLIPAATAIYMRKALIDSNSYYQ